MKANTLPLRTFPYKNNYMHLESGTRPNDSQFIASLPDSTTKQNITHKSTKFDRVNRTNAPMVDRFRPTIRIYLLDTNQLDVKDQRAVCWDDWRVAFCAVCVIWCARQFSTLANAHLKEYIPLDYTTPV